MKKYFVILTILIPVLISNVLMMSLTAEGAGINDVKKTLKSDAISSQNSKSINQSIPLKNNRHSIMKKKSKNNSDNIINVQQNEKTLISNSDPTILNVIKSKSSIDSIKLLVNSVKAYSPKKAPAKIGRISESLRIDEQSSLPSKNEVIKITSYEEYARFFPASTNQMELEARGYLELFVKNSDYFLEFFTYLELKSVLYGFCVKYSEFPHLCDAMKLFYAEVYNG